MIWRTRKDDLGVIADWSDRRVEQLIRQQKEREGRYSSYDWAAKWKARQQPERVIRQWRRAG